MLLRSFLSVMIVSQWCGFAPVARGATNGIAAQTVVACGGITPAQADGAGVPGEQGEPVDGEPSGSEGILGSLTSLLERVTGLDVEQWGVVGLSVLAVMVLGAGLWIAGRIRRAIRRGRPARLHPKLQQYGGMDPEFVAQRREEAARIVATSSTSEIAGYHIIKQVEAVFVDGFRRAEDALEGVKAVAAMKGANAVTNVRHERGAMGRWSAAGDAVVVGEGERSSDQGTGKATGAARAVEIQPVDVGPIPEAERYQRDITDGGETIDAEIVAKRAAKKLPPPDQA
ncbi:MAG: hypothetical protein ACPGXK_02035 [Phycisphaerae bacterium]